MDELEPRYTKIEKLIYTKFGQVLLEDHTGFPFGESNLYCLGNNGEIVWQAEKPDLNSHFVRVKLNDDGITLSTYANTGIACEIELSTGKLISQIAFD
ncbi:MAG: hypothetical protein QGM50_03430 [Anaerolineae bacterium]|nr:hypothetical protein [Anaerolineae bacterium]